MVRCLKVEFDGHWYSWFDCDDLQESKIQRFPDILKQNITHYFNIPPQYQVIFDCIGRLNSDSDLFRVFDSKSPTIKVYDQRRGVNEPTATCPVTPELTAPHRALASNSPVSRAVPSAPGPGPGPEPRMLEVKLHKFPGERYGFTNISCQTALVVSSVECGGILDRWNAALPDKAVMPGDVILSVNEKKDPQAMREQLQKDELFMVLRRGASFDLGDNACRSPVPRQLSPPPCAAHTHVNGLSPCAGATVFHHVVHSPPPQCVNPGMVPRCPRPCAPQEVDATAARHFAECARMNEFCNTWKGRREETGRLLKAFSPENAQSARHDALFTAMDEMARRCAQERQGGAPYEQLARIDMHDCVGARPTGSPGHFDMCGGVTSPGLHGRSGYPGVAQPNRMLTPDMGAFGGKMPPQYGKKHDLARIERIVRDVVRVLDVDEDGADSTVDLSEANGRKAKTLRTHIDKEIEALKRAREEDYTALRTLIEERVQTSSEAHVRRSTFGKVTDSLRGVEDTVANVQRQRERDVSRLELLQDELDRSANRDIVHVLDEQLGGQIGIRDLLAKQACGQQQQSVDELALAIESTKKAMHEETAQSNQHILSELNSLRAEMSEKESFEAEWRKDRDEQQRVIGELVLQLQDTQKAYENLESRIATQTQAPPVRASEARAVPQAQRSATAGLEPEGSDGMYVSDGSLTDNAVAEVLNEFGGAIIAGQTWRHVSGNTYMWGTRRLWIKATEEGPKVRVGGTVTLLTEYLQEMLSSGNMDVVAQKPTPKDRSLRAKTKAKAKARSRVLQDESDGSMDFANPYAAAL